MRIIPILALLLLLTACGTTPEGEKRQQALFGTFIAIETEIPLADGRVIPFKLEWDTGTAKSRVEIWAYHPGTGTLLFHYLAEDVSHVEAVLDTLAKVKGAIAAQQLSLGAGVVRGLIDAVTQAVLVDAVTRVIMPGAPE